MGRTVTGAASVASGFGGVRAVAPRMLRDAFDELEMPSEDYKSTLRELLQEQERRIPRYRISSQEGPDHARIFVASVEASGRILGEGRGSSKKQAEQAAAREALRHLARRGRTGETRGQGSGAGGRSGNVEARARPQTPGPRHPPTGQAAR